jgi:NAD+ diphosphatase
MIQDIFPAVLDNHYENKEPDAGSKLMFIKGDDVLYKVSDGKIEFPSYSECDTDGIDIRYLFSIDDTGYFLAFKEVYGKEGLKASAEYKKLLNTLLSRGFEFRNRMSLRYGGKDRVPSFAGAIAYQLGRWYADNRICGRCGRKLVHDGAERMMKCPNCNNMIFPKICPAVIVAVVDGDRILLTKYSTGFKNFALIAGFAETGETIEETVHREVMEEVGIKVKNLRYYKSQPWVFTDTLLFGFFCEPDSDKNITIDHNELSYASWVSRQDVQQIKDDDISLTYEMMKLFKEGREYSF